MGNNNSSTPVQPNLCVRELYKKYLPPGVIGGDENDCCVGGLEDISKLLPPLSSARKSLIKDIAVTMGDKLKIPGLSNIKDKNIDEVIDLLRKHVPDPRKGKGNDKVWSDKESNQVKACKIIAEIINEKFGKDIVDLNAKPEEICDSVSELVYSLFTGIHGEFVVVKKDVERILKNIRVLEEFMERGYNLMVSKINAEKDSNLGTETALIQDAHRDAMLELGKQRTMLENMLNTVIKPSEKDLDELLKESTELKNLVKKIKQYPGTSKFAEKLSYLMSGIRSIAQAAKVTDSALNKLGISHQEYKKLSDFKTLKNVLNEKTQQLLNSPEADLITYEKAKEVLYRYQYLHDDIVNELTKEKTGREEHIQEYKGGSVVGGLKLDKRVKRRQELRKQLLKAFNQRLGSLFDKVLISGKHIGEYVGSGKLHLSDDLNKFVDALENVPKIQKKYVYYSLSGYQNSIESKQDRELFISSVRYLNSTIDNLIGDKDYAKVGFFKDMKSSFEEIIKLIEEFSSKFEQGFGVIDTVKKKSEGGDSKSFVKKIGEKVEKYVKESPENLRKAKEFANEAGKVLGELSESAEKVLGRADETEDDFEELNVEGGYDEILPEITRIAYMLDKSKEIITYQFRIAKIRENLLKASTEMPEYGEDYVKILADAVANSVDQIIEEKNKYIQPDYETNVAHVLHSVYVELTTAPGAPRTKLPPNDFEKGKEKYMRIVDFISKLYDTKIEIYRVAEAVDLYMKAFADALVANPDDIKDIIHTLSGTEIVSKWFTNKSGDYLCQVFDTFPSMFVDHDAVYCNINEAVDKSQLSNSHYYLKVSSVCKLGEYNKINADFPDIFPADGVGVSLDKWKRWSNANSVSLSGIVNPGTNELGLPGHPFMGLPICGTNLSDKKTAIQAAKYLEKSFSISLLKNIMAMFINIGRKFGGKDIEKQTHMSPIQIYRGLLNYSIYGSFTFGTTTPTTSASDANMRLGMNGNAYTTFGKANNNLRSINRISVGLTGLANLDAAPAATNIAERRNTYVTIRGTGNSVNASLKNIFGSEFDQKGCDLLYQLILKSIVAKVLTTIGVYNMFHKPMTKHGLGYPSDLRMILGGADGIPKIINEALELYVKLPLLAETYRELFNFEETETDKIRNISLVPEMEGVFSGLVNLIFDKNKNIKEGTYSIVDAKLLIEEINKIYLRFKDHKNPINDVYDEFIAEINRRYGVIKREDRLTYLRDKERKYEYTKTEEITDFELEGLDESDDYVRPAPSQSYQLKGGPGYTGGIKHKHKLDLGNDIYAVNKLRDAINDIFQRVKDVLGENGENQENLKTKISFTELLKSRSEELKHAKSDKEKFDIVHTAINSLGQFAVSAIEKSIILFHETVVYPLNVLHSNYLILKKFEDKIIEIHNAYDALDSWLSQNNPVLSTLNVVTFGNFIYKDTGKSVLNFIGPFMNLYVNRPVGDAPVDYNALPDTNIAVYPGTQGLPSANAPVTYANINAMLVADPAKGKKYASRFVIDNNKVFLSLFETIFSHTSAFDKVVELKIDVQKALGVRPTNVKPGDILPGDLCEIMLYIDHSKLFNIINESYMNIKQNIDKFRGLIPKNHIEKYELITSEGKDNIGSLYWIEKNLINELIQGRRNGQEGKIVTIDLVNTKIKEIFTRLTKPWNFNGRVGALNALPANFGTKLFSLTANGAIGGEVNTLTSYHEYTRDLYRIIFYDPEAVIYTFSRTPSSYNALNVHSGATKLKTVAGVFNTPVRDQMTLENLLFNLSGKIKNGVASGDPWDPSLRFRYNRIYDQYVGGKFTHDSLSGDSSLNSVFILFNRLVAAYIHQAYDHTTKKIYSSTINSFANGAFSAAVMGDKNFNDESFEITNNILNSVNGRYSGVLFKSLGLILRHLLTDMDDRTNKKQFLESDLNEIPLFVKERYKANLPIFNKLFTFLIKRCELAKHMCRALNVEQEINLPTGGAVSYFHTLVFLGPAVAPAAPVASEAPQVSRTDNERQLIAVLDQIIQGCTAINQCIKETISELADDPKYLETYHGSISVYENENGKLPFMPLSSIGYYLKNITVGQKVVFDDTIKSPMMPLYDLGDNRFKLLYGTRKILMHESKLDDMPGAKDLVKQHNYSAEGRHSFDEKYIDAFLQNILCLSKYIIDLKHYASFMNLRYVPTDSFNLQTSIDGLAGFWDENTVKRAYYSHAFTDLVGPANLGVTPRNAAYQLLQFRDKNTVLNDVITLTESAFQKEQKSKIIDTVESVNGCPQRYDRKFMLGAVLIDLNKPILNLWALRREIPMIHLINYAYTFDYLICELFGIRKPNKLADTLVIDLEDEKNAAGVYEKVGIKKYMVNERLYEEKEPAKRLLGYLLLYPYASISNDVYDFYLPAILRGSMGIQGLGRPKYLGDEIYNKALFGEIYPGTVYEEEGGPGVGMGHLRGKQEVLADSVFVPEENTYKQLIIRLVYDLIRSHMRSTGAPGGINNDHTGITDAEHEDFVNHLFGTYTKSDLNFNTGVTLKSIYNGMSAYISIVKGAITNKQKDAYLVILITVFALVTIPKFSIFFAYKINNFMANNPGFDYNTSDANITSKFHMENFIDVNILQMLTSLVPNKAGVEIWKAAPGAANTNVDGIVYLTSASYLKLELNNRLSSLFGRPPVVVDITAGGFINDAAITMADWDSAAPIAYIRDVLKTMGPKSYESLPKTKRTVIEENNSKYFNGKLHYMDENGNIKNVDVGGNKETLRIYGQHRFNTITVRNLFCTTNIQRALRLKLRRDLSYYDSRIVKDLSVTAPSITESFGNSISSNDKYDEYNY